uniref:Cytochrome c oxidase subunit 3 n=1 Tax=Idioscopus sp. 'myrica' TaxID=2419687 RepID=A0A386PYZ7_9HEMI|nr:cytochrome c oxidase subunit III [Idioscopus sp. 'myrica']WEP24789.1 cytochrome c oxidase subunit III [Idioscopus sp. 'myrica']
MNNHPFHLVDKSPWPLMSSMGLMTMTSGAIIWFNKLNWMLMIIGLIIILLTMFQWWRDIIRESTFQGKHTQKVMKSMKWGMIMFIMSEVMFFSAFFWAFFHSSLSPSMEIGLQWPPMGVKPFNPMNIPLLNTMILLSSGVSMTWAHNSVLNNNYTQTLKSMMITIMLGVYFSILQLYEYMESSFSIADSIYGSTFFMGTGFHGIHVMIGTMFITIMMMRVKNLHMSNMHHIGFELSAWYWHFVDVVWLFLYIMIYWWGS